MPFYTALHDDSVIKLYGHDDVSCFSSHRTRLNLVAILQFGSSPSEIGHVCSMCALDGAPNSKYKMSLMFRCIIVHVFSLFYVCQSFVWCGFECRENRVWDIFVFIHENIALFGIKAQMSE